MFKRKISRIDSLQMLASDVGENWWKDLLRLWSPSGMDAGMDGLRLAIRENYLNFYHRGQSVAQVAFDRAGMPYVSVHLKYLGVEVDGYAKLKDHFFIFGKDSIPFKQGKSFLEIIEKSKMFAGKEKFFVDKAVAQNESVIDLEISLPRLGDQGGAPRMDLALLEQGYSAGQVKLVFWEAKTIDDTRLRAKNPDDAEVHEQLEKYVTFMSNSERRSDVAKAYREYCILLVKLASMAPKDKPVTLSSLILSVAQHGKNVELIVEEQPRLVIFEGDTENKSKKCHIQRANGWPKYRQSLLARWKLTEFAGNTPYKLSK